MALKSDYDIRNPHGVKVGQVWVDTDPRMNRGDGLARYLLVREVDLHTGKAVLVESTEAGVPWPTGETARVTRISVKRMRPTSNGYRLIRDSVSGSGSA